MGHMKSLPWKRLALALGGLLALALIAGVGFMIFLPTSAGRAWLAQTMASSASSDSRGTVQVDAIEEVSFDRLVLKGYRVIAPDGETVIHVNRLSGDPVVSDLFNGQIHLVDARFESATIRLTPGPQGQVNLVYASEVPDERSGMTVIIEDIELVNNQIFVDLPGKPSMQLSEISGLAHLEIGHHFLWRLDNTQGRVDLPIVGDTKFTDMHGRLKSDHAHPLIVEMAVDLSLAEPVANLDYYVPSIAGEKGEPHFDLDLPDGVFAGGDRDADDAGDGPPAPGKTRKSEADEDVDEDTDEDVDENVDEANAG